MSKKRKKPKTDEQPKTDKIGRPTIVTPEVEDKIRQAYLIGANNREASRFAGISERTLYNHMDRHPEFVQKVNEWKQRPILKAKKTIIDNLKDVKTAQWYLERKAKDEFGTNIDITSGQRPIPIIPINEVKNINISPVRENGTEVLSDNSHTEDPESE